MDEAEIDLAEVLAIADRREMLCRRPPRCPAPDCGTEQVQLVDHVAKPAQWKCRYCRRPFAYEPSA